MKEMTKSILSFSYALPLFGFKQMVNLVTPEDPARPTHEAVTALDAVTHAAQGQLGDTLGELYKQGDAVQRGAVDFVFGFVNLESFTPSSMLRLATDTVERSADLLRRTTASKSAKA